VSRLRMCECLPPSPIPLCGVVITPKCRSRPFVVYKLPKSTELKVTDFPIIYGHTKFKEWCTSVFMSQGHVSVVLVIIVSRVFPNARL
jgi:hypothetical protein